MTKQPVADCRACLHSISSTFDVLLCGLFKCHADLPCARFEREPGSDVEEYIALQDGTEQGLGD